MDLRGLSDEQLVDLLADLDIEGDPKVGPLFWDVLEELDTREQQAALKAGGH